MVMDSCTVTVIGGGNGARLPQFTLPPGDMMSGSGRRWQGKPKPCRKGQAGKALEQQFAGEK